MKRNKGLIITLIIFIIATITLGSYIVYDKMLKDKAPEKKETEVIDDKENNSTFVSKKYNDKNWVYDAEYEKSVNASSYQTAFNETYSVSDIVVPFINVDSTYATYSNEEIKKVFDSAIQTFNQGVSDQVTFVDKCNYKKYITNDLVSILVNYAVGGTDIVKSNYYVYNIDLKTGNELSYEDVYKLVGLDSKNINSKVEEAISKIMKEKMKDFTDTDYEQGTDFNTYNNKSIDNYKKSVNDNSLKYFIAEDGKLNIVVKLHIPVGMEEFDTVITID